LISKSEFSTADSPYYRAKTVLHWSPYILYGFPVSADLAA